MRNYSEFGAKLRISESLRTGQEEQEEEALAEDHEEEDEVSSQDLGLRLARLRSVYPGGLCREEQEGNEGHQVEGGQNPAASPERRLQIILEDGRVRAHEVLVRDPPSSRLIGGW